ncbi:TIGR03619 family F420-dependent LLM class oxidoreductase [Pseudonocardia sp. CA-107938]|uniref:TIGR03619 family F420-dependent LLM class oxidoreductase n=1 Tax=Pseudonocardia sp. CA-107938 TaxID=3240021 RepID=UPI003D8EEB70
MGLSFGLYGLHKGSSTDPATMARRAAAAEAAGFESLWVGDHIALPVDAPDSADQPRIEAVVALSYLAAVTTRVRLGFGVIVLPQRQPVLLAKQDSSIDALSQGRLIVGVGVGYLAAEFRALGVSLGERAARTDEYLTVMRTLWAEGTPAHDGRFVSFDGVLQRPRPVQQPGPPIVVGGHAAASYRRAVERGNGWYGWELTVDEATAAIAALREAEQRHERPAELGELEITITPPAGLTADLARRYADVGVHRLLLQAVDADGDEVDQLIETAGETLIGRA